MYRARRKITGSYRTVGNYHCPTVNGFGTIRLPHHLGRNVINQQQNDASHVLLIGDDQNTATLLKDICSSVHSHCSHYSLNPDAVLDACNTEWDLLIVHATAPCLQSTKICNTVRNAKPLSQIIFISGVDDNVSYVLTQGADDVIKMPSQSEEIAGRVKCALRRSVAIQQHLRGSDSNSGAVSADANHSAVEPTKNSHDVGSFYLAGDLKVYKHRHEVTVAEKLVSLTYTEFALLAYLVENMGRPCSKEELLSLVLGYRDENYTASLHSHVSRLRRKLEKAGSSTTSIETLWRFGYRVTVRQPLH